MGSGGTAPRVLSSSNNSFQSWRRFAIASKTRFRSLQTIYLRPTSFPRFLFSVSVFQHKINGCFLFSQTVSIWTPSPPQVNLKFQNAETNVFVIDL